MLVSGLPGAFSDELDAEFDVVRLVPVALAVSWLQVFECVEFVAAAAHRGDVINGESEWVQVVCLVVNRFSAQSAWWFVGGDDAAVSVAAGSVALHRKATEVVVQRSCPPTAHALRPGVRGCPSG